MSMNARQPPFYVNVDIQHIDAKITPAAMSARVRMVTKLWHVNVQVSDLLKLQNLEILPHPSPPPPIY